jgi:dGTPase
MVTGYRDDTLADHPSLGGRRLLYETIRRMLSAQVYDVIDATRLALQSSGVVEGDADAARRSVPLVQFSAEMRSSCAKLKQFLFHDLYRHPQVVQTTLQAQQVVRDLFAAYVADPAQMQVGYATRPDRERAVADYIAGMTDRFAVREHERLTGRRVLA